jgi:hypothetical protein
MENSRNFQAEKFKCYVRQLIHVAKQKRCVTYNELENLFGLSHEQVGYYAGALGDYCISRKLPPLNALIISSTDCVPSHGFDWYQEQYNLTWGELVTKCWKFFHVTLEASKKSKDYGGRDTDVDDFLSDYRGPGYIET